MKGKAIKYRYKTKPYPFQRRALKKCMGALARNGGFGLYLDPGTGKTKVAIDAACIMFLKHGWYRILVIAPITPLGVWEDEIAKHTPENIPYVVHRLTGTTRQREAQLVAIAAAPEPELKLTWILVNYESAILLMGDLIDWEPQGVMVDEVHYIKSYKAKRSRLCHELRHMAQFRIGLSGTPQPKNQLDHFSPFKFYDESIFGTSWTFFRHTYAIFGGYLGKEILGFRNSKQLRKKIEPLIFRITKEKALKLPEKVYQYIPIDLLPSTRRIYDEMARDAIAYIEESQKDKVAIGQIVLTQLMRLQQITSGFVKDVMGTIHQVGSEKLDASVELVGDLVENGQKVVIVCTFLWELMELRKRFRAKSMEVLTIYGDVPGELRDKKRKVFQSNPRYQIMIIQIASALGIDLTAASTMIFQSVDYRLDHYIQSCDRIHRHGQTQKVTYLHLVGRGTVDDRVYQALAAKQNLSDLVLDSWRDWFMPGIPRSAGTGNHYK